MDEIIEYLERRGLAGIQFRESILIGGTEIIRLSDSSIRPPPNMFIIRLTDKIWTAEYEVGQIAHIAIKASTSPLITAKAVCDFQLMLSKSGEDYRNTITLFSRLRRDGLLAEVISDTEIYLHEIEPPKPPSYGLPYIDILMSISADRSQRRYICMTYTENAWIITMNDSGASTSLANTENLDDAIELVIERYGKKG